MLSHNTEPSSPLCYDAGAEQILKGLGQRSSDYCCFIILMLESPGIYSDIFCMHFWNPISLDLYICLSLAWTTLSVVVRLKIPGGPWYSFSALAKTRLAAAEEFG